MALAPGVRVGIYEIVETLGKGGMGEVYRAVDSSLGRVVALKILPDMFARDADRVARFEREAKTLASLNHPYIAQIYGLEKRHLPEAGLPASVLVMEHVPGEDLSREMSRGPMPLEQAIPIARQLADALEAAHEQGIVHRGLKPANVMLRPDGTIKILDFGLAKVIDAPGSASADRVADSPTLTAHSTELGTLLGTPGYMAPEQARGRSVDKRGDIWAFGVILFEMVSGQRLFVGETTSEILASVLSQSIPWNRLPAGTPGNVRHILTRCLEPDPRVRLRDIGEARVLFDANIDHTSKEVVSPPARRFWQRAVGVGALAVAVGARAPFFSHDGREIGFFTTNELRRIPAGGGVATTISRAAGGGAGDWAADGTILYQRWAGEGGLWRVSARGGEPQLLVPAKKEGELRRARHCYPTAATTSILLATSG